MYDGRDIFEEQGVIKTPFTEVLELFLLAKSNNDVNYWRSMESHAFKNPSVCHLSRLFFLSATTI